MGYLIPYSKRKNGKNAGLMDKIPRNFSGMPRRLTFKNILRGLNVNWVITLRHTLTTASKLRINSRIIKIYWNRSILPRMKILTNASTMRDLLPKPLRSINFWILS